jgi:[acyl-carrier-protein] S-malonyltransferase
VISGHRTPPSVARERAEKARARKVARLPISIGSHSPLMAKASDGMNALLQKVRMRDPEHPMVGNVNAELLETQTEVYAELRDQLTHGVRWQKSVETMRDQGADMFMEVGPGNVLTRLVRRIDYSLNSLALSDENDGLLSENFRLVEATAQ